MAPLNPSVVVSCNTFNEIVTRVQTLNIGKKQIRLHAVQILEIIGDLDIGDLHARSNAPFFSQGYSFMFI